MNRTSYSKPRLEAVDDLLDQAQFFGLQAIELVTHQQDTAVELAGFARSLAAVASALMQREAFDRQVQFSEAIADAAARVEAAFTPAAPE